jgi:hypothetical protein
MAAALKKVFHFRPVHPSLQCYIPAKFNSEAWVWGRLSNPLRVGLTGPL